MTLLSDCGMARNDGRTHGAAKPMIGEFGFSRIHDYGLGRLHIHELVFDLLHGVQAKFLRFFGAAWEQPQIARMTRIGTMPNSERRMTDTRECPRITRVDTKEH
jgi:hypothetical protein